jgi:hypothetical protein
LSARVDRLSIRSSKGTLSFLKLSVLLRQLLDKVSYLKRIVSPFFRFKSNHLLDQVFVN